MPITSQMQAIPAVLLLTLLFGCAANGGNASSQTHLSAAQCRDLTDIRNKAPATHERNASELAALRQAGYYPERRFDPDYPASLERAQRQVDIWYQAECPQAHSG
jgi:hypothetical protein